MSKAYRFITDKDGNIIGHTDPEFAQNQLDGQLVYPDPLYQEDDENWLIKNGMMVQKDNGLPSYQGLQQQNAMLSAQLMQTQQEYGKQIAGLTATLMQAQGGTK
ncbi:hypothetical protein ACNAN0_03955 [Agrilactobacillus fermenti]|uniref:hypothetical protein n=1 Tax=Agrilactobacillus fermenti TaxID=2586909 RepID=UPI003A5C5398